MRTIVLISRPNNDEEYNQFKNLNIFIEDTCHFNNLVDESSALIKIVILKRDEWDDDESLKLLDQKHIEFINSLVENETNTLLLVHDHSENVAMAEKTNAQYKIKYTTVENTNVLSLKVRDKQICIRNSGQETFYTATDLSAFVNYLFGLCKKVNKLETALEFLHKCLMDVPPLPDNIDRSFKQTMYVGKDNDGSIGAFYEKWNENSNVESLSVLRDVVLEWAENK